jgi:Holliday junction resolvasome RuvABC endonuclease subunit
MKVLGIRVDPQKTRYALIDYDGNVFTLLNANTESRLLYPANVSEPDEKVDWLYRELERVLHAHQDIEKVCIKTNEYTQSDSKSKRESAYLEGAVLLFCRRNNIPVTVKIYASLSTRSADVRGHAEQRVGRTAKYWDSKMADAVIAAWHGARN